MWNHRRGEGRPPLMVAAALLTLLIHLAGPAPSARAQDPSQSPTPKERQELERRGAQLNQAAIQHQARGEYEPAVVAMKQALTIVERLYPKGRYPRGHPNLAGASHNMGMLLQESGNLSGATEYHQRALEMTEALYPREQYPNGHQHLAYCLTSLGSILQEQGDYDGARASFQRALAMDQALYPEERSPNGHPDLATSLNNLGNLLQARGDYDQAQAYLERALAMNQALYPKDRLPNGHPDLATSLNNLGNLLQARGDYDDARAYLERAMAMRQALYPKERFPHGHLRLSTSLNNLGNLLRARGDYDEARTYLERALAMRQALYPRDRFPLSHPDVAASLNDLGTLLQNQGDHDGARTYFERALAMRQALYPGDRFPHGHPDLAISLSNLGGLLQARGDYDSARGYLERAMAMRQALYPRDSYPRGHPDLAMSLSNLGALLQARGDYDGARGNLERALAMRQAVYPRDRFPRGHPQLAVSLNNLGALLRARGDHGGARVYYERALAMNQALYPKDRFPHGHPLLAASLSNLGGLLQARGDYDGARAYLERALAMRQALYPRERYPRGHPDLAVSLSSLGGLLVAQGDYVGAGGYLERALEINEALYPKDRLPHGHPDLATSLNDLGTLLRVRMDYDGARAYLERALVMRRAFYPKDRYPQGHPDLARSLSNLGELLQAGGDYDGARGHFERALAMRQALYPRERYARGHPDLAASLNNLGGLLENEGELGAAWPLLQQAVDMYEDGADLFRGDFSEAESYDYLTSLPGTIHGLLTVSCRLPGQAEATYARVWRNKAAVTRALQQRHAALTLRAGADPDTRRSLDSWREVRRQIARLMVATSDGRDDPDRVRQLRLLSIEKERLERALAATIPEFAREQDVARSPHTRLIELLPAGTVVLDLVAFNRSEQDPKVRGERGRRLIPGYVGFVLARGQPVRQVDLGPARPIDDAVRSWRAAILNRQASPDAEIIRRKVWEPLARHFPPRTTTVLIAPDEIFTAIPWGALPGDRPGTVLLEQCALATIPHAPFVLERLTAPAPTQGEGDVVLAVGGVDYDGTPKPLGKPAVRADLLALRRAETERGRGPGGDGDGWKSLPGTAREVEAVAERSEPRSLLRLQGTDASTARLLIELPKARWAHIATHGFFADPNIRSILQPDPRLFAFEGRQHATGLRNPLVLSGLVLAGANRPSGAIVQADQSTDDLGIVTAEAIAGLPLQDLDLVVLSACETGLGLIGRGEGVFGLQRAFHLAGAHNVVASLWKVDDDATAATMAIFYDRLWRQGKPPIEALREAQLMLYRDPTLVEPPSPGPAARPTSTRRSGAPEPVPGAGGPGPRRADAKDWAAFVLSGWGR